MPAIASNAKLRMALPQRRAMRSSQRQLDESLLSAAERLLERGHSLQGLTVAQLAREAGLSSRVFYRYFDDKDEWMAGAIETVCVELVESAGSVLSRARRPQDIVARLKAMTVVCRKRHAFVLAIDDIAWSCPAAKKPYLAMRQAISGHSHAGSAEALAWALVLYLARFAPWCAGADFERLLQSAAQMLLADESRGLLSANPVVFETNANCGNESGDVT